MRIAVLMTCYNRVGTTLECLRRLFAQKVPEGYSLDVWLVDDASPDKTGENVKAAYPQVNVIQGTGKLVWCKGMRLAWEKAAAANDYDGYLWLNDDVLLKDSAMEGMLRDCECIERDGDGRFVLVGTCSNNAGRLSYGCYLYSEGAKVLAPCGSPVKVDEKYEMSGNIVYVPRAVFKEVGFIYGGYSHAYGDSDYRQMLLKKNIPMYCASTLVGLCKVEPGRYVMLETATFRERVASLFSPKGRPLRDVVLYRWRHWGCARAVVSVAHVVILVLFPRRARK